MKHIVRILIVAFVCSLLGPVQALAQTPHPRPALTGNIVNDIKAAEQQTKKDIAKVTGVTPTGDVGFDLLKMLDAKLLPDLQYAQKLADANGNKLTSNCWGAWISVIQTNQTAVQNKNADGTTTDIAVPDPHLITDLERAIDIRNALQPQSPFMVACSPVANLIKTDVMNFIGQVVGGGLSLTKLVPGLL